MNSKEKTRSSAATPERAVDGQKNAGRVALQMPVCEYDSTIGAEFQAQQRPNVLTVRQVGEILGISVPTAYKVVHRADFPKIFVGRSIRIPAANFECWLAKQADLGADILGGGVL